MQPTPTRIGDLISLGPECVRHWHKQLRDGYISPPKSWSLLGLAQAAAHRARADLNSDWLAAALEILEALAQSEGGRKGETHLLAAMHLRAYFLRQSTPNPARDAAFMQQMVEWFRSRLPLSQEEVRNKILDLDALSVAEMLELRDLKNRIGVFQNLRMELLLDRYDDIGGWLSLRSQLP